MGCMRKLLEVRVFGGFCFFVTELFLGGNIWRVMKHTPTISTKLDKIGDQFTQGSVPQSQKDYIEIFLGSLFTHTTGSHSSCFRFVSSVFVYQKASFWILEWEFYPRDDDWTACFFWYIIPGLLVTEVSGKYTIPRWFKSWPFYPRSLEVT